MNYKIYYTNHRYYADQEFNTFEEAVAYGKEHGFDFRIDRDGTPIAAWSIIIGLRYFRQSVNY